MGNFAFVIAICVTLLLTAVSVNKKSNQESNQPVNNDAEIIKARVIVSDFDKRLKSVEQKLPMCKHDKQCIYNTYSFNGFAYTDLTPMDGVIVLKSSIMSDIKKTREIATSPLAIEVGASK